MVIERCGRRSLWHFSQPSWLFLFALSALICHKRRVLCRKAMIAFPAVTRTSGSAIAFGPQPQGRSSMPKEGGAMQSLPLCKALGVPGAHCALCSCCGPCQLCPFVAAGLLLLLSGVPSRSCASTLLPSCHCGAGVLQLCGKAACRDGAGYCFPEPSMSSLCCPCVGQVHQNA